MASPDNQQHWLPFEINKDCSQGLCSKYCPQWCYTIYTPSPPFGYPDQESDSNFSPLVIAIIGILASAFLLVSYYTIAAKYCGNFGAWRNRIHRNPDEILEENRSSVQNEPWHIVTTGLEEALIKSIAVCKYKKGDGLIEGTDCSVCLSEFQEGESLRLLPKCSHAFHLPCIDTWLQSHSNCPLCRANIVSTTMVPQLPAPEEFSGDESSPENRIVVNGLSSLDEEAGVVDLGENRELEDACGSKVGKFRALSDLGVSEEDVIIEINDEVQPIRRSVSMDFSCRSRVSIADILASDDFPAKVNSIPAWVKPFEGEQSKGKEAYANRVLRSVKAPMAMKRSFSSGRFLFTRHGRGKSAVLPV